MRSREELERLVAERTSDGSAIARRADRSERRAKEIEQAIDELTIAEGSALIDLEAASHPDGTHKRRKTADVAIELASIRGGLAELTRYLRDTQREVDLERDNARRCAAEVDRFADQLSERGATASD
jgi:hypothetical protein